LLAGTFLPDFCFFQNVSCPSLDIGARSEQGFFRVIDQEERFLGVSQRARYDTQV
jgi:hypothetical protein